MKYDAVVVSECAQSLSHLRFIPVETLGAISRTVGGR
ncbi:amino acid deaminase (plasmid) [Ralstonia solanacearum]